MRTLLYCIVAAHFALAACSGPPMSQTSVGKNLPTFELVNGHWYTGTDFEAMTMYTADGMFRVARPVSIDSVIDLDGGYVVPPFGEAHTHRGGYPARVIGDATFFLESGIYYVMNQGNLARYRDALDSLVNRPRSIDALFANALIASPQSHGVDLWQRLVGRGAFPGVEVDALDGDAYVVVETSEDVVQRLPHVLETGADFIKIMVEYSEEHISRRDNPQFFGQSGLDPALVPLIVSLANDAGVRVSAHVETAADFHVAVAAGVDIVAHLPGYDIPEGDDVARYRIDPADAALASEQGTIVLTTTLLSVDRADGDSARLERMQDNQAHNLRLLAEAGVVLAVGSDQYSKNSVDEVMNLASLNVFDPSTLLNMLCSVTPQAIFPDRRLGVLEDGAEASFLVLRGNPNESLERLREITLRVKDGNLLDSF